jgi:hypothetical protein
MAVMPHTNVDRALDADLSLLGSLVGSHYWGHILNSD